MSIIEMVRVNVGAATHDKIDAGKFTYKRRFLWFVWYADGLYEGPYFRFNDFDDYWDKL